jgi:Ca2+-binding RTX toxin-like protein
MQSDLQQNYPGSNSYTVFSTPDQTVTDINLASLSSPLLVKESWKVGVFGSGIGASGIITADIDNDGIVEIVAAGSNSTFGSGNFWYILEKSSTSQEYSQRWLSNLESAGISKIAAFDPDQDGIYSIFVGLANGEIHIYDGATLEKVGYLDTPASSINQILWADADNDSINELIVSDNQNTFLYDSTSLSLKHQIAYGGSDVEVGNVDSDSANEIVFSTGTVVEVNGTTTKEDWKYAGGSFGSLIELSDIDSDNIQEIIGASSWYDITAFDADVQSPKWQINTNQDIDALLVTDVDNDGVEEVIYGDGQWGEIHAYDAVTLTQKWQINNPDHGVTDIAVFDTDGDGEQEILWGSGASSTGADYLYVHGIPSLTQEWQSQHIDGPFHAIDVGDIDGDGTEEIVFASFKSDSGYDDGTLFIYDAQTHALEWQSPANMFGGSAWTGIHDIKIGDVDDDGTQEIVVATDKLYDGALYVIDGQTKQIEKSYFYDDGAPLYSVDIADVDNDGQTEIIAGGGREHTGAPGVSVYAINGSTGAVEWKSINLGDYWSDINFVQVGNVDNDNAPEIVALKDSIFIFDGISHQQWQSASGGYTSLDLYDIDNDGLEEIIVGTNQGNIVAIDGQTKAEEFNINVSSSAIVGLQAQDIDQDGIVELTFTSSAAVGIYSLEESTLLWKSDTLGSSAGDYNSLIVSNIDSDEPTEILVGTNYTVVEFEASANALNNLLVGNEGDNVLVGGDGDDTFNGGGGQDTLDGGLGNDTYYVNPTTTIVEGVDAGIDTVISSFFSWTLEANLENLTLQGDNPITGKGNQLDNTITGNNANNILCGKQGNDTLLGERGNDCIVGGTGDDVLTGGDGADRFIRKYSITGIDTITDFQVGQDKLYFSASGFGSDLVRGRVLGEEQFTLGTAAATGSDRFIYDTDTGNLFFDVDGTGATAQVLLATLSTGLALTKDDIFIFA